MRIVAKRIGKVVLFMAVFLVLFFAASFFVQPYWDNWGNQDVSKGFYSEPKNTVETVFVGASMSTAGITPMELYRDYGICSYNLGTGAQPVLMSYYFVKDAYRLHPESLKTVVFDVSMIRRLTTDAMYHKVLDFMPLSKVKLEAIGAISNGYREYLANLIPLFSYHDRWKEIGRSDFDKYTFKPMKYIRGFNYESHRIFDDYTYADMPVPVQVIDENAPEAAYDSEQMFYLKQMIDFCQESGLKLVLLKTPSPANWSSKNHNAVAAIAERYGLDFLDFDAEPLINEINFIPGTDCRDNEKHLNYYGAAKLTNRLGKYLVEECQATDVRGDSRFAFMDEQLKQYEENILAYHEAVESVDIAEYLEKLSALNVSVLITLKDTGSAMFSDEQRARIEALGFRRLPKLGYRTSYIGVMDNGKVVKEMSKREQSAASNPSEEGGVVNDLENIVLEADEEAVDNQVITYSGMLPDGTPYTLMSGSYKQGNIASCVLPDGEWAKNVRGLNMVIYNNDTHLVADSTVFDLHVYQYREPYNLEKTLEEKAAAGTPFENLSDDLQKLVRYKASLNLRQQAKKANLEIGDMAMPAYLKYYMEQEGLCIAVAVKDDASTMLTPEAKEALAGIGFKKISDLQYRDSYIAFVEDGKIIYEEISHGEEPLVYTWNDCTVKSGGKDSGYIASACVAGNELLPNTRGFDVVVFDPDMKVAVDSTTFDTIMKELDLAEYPVSCKIDRTQAAYKPAVKEE